MSRKLLKVALLCAVVALIFAMSIQAQNRRGQRPQVCGEPSMNCAKANEFQPHDLQFHLPRKAVIYETEPFYAVILQSISGKTDCDAHISEGERLEAQKLFPRNKVFANRCPEPGVLYYSNTDSDYRFMAVYAGMTRADANRMLARVRATGKYPTANIRRMSTGFNGT